MFRTSPKIGQELLDVPMGDMIQQMAFAIAEAQIKLDTNSIEVAQMMGGLKTITANIGGEEKKIEQEILKILGKAEEAANFPVFVNEDYPLSRDDLYFQMRDKDILGRRYFYPLISEMPMYRKLPSAAPENLPQAHKASKQVICLPIYPDLAMDDVERVCEAIRKPENTTKS